jgi:hypothetical protein
MARRSVAPMQVVVTTRRARPRSRWARREQVDAIGGGDLGLEDLAEAGLAEVVIGFEAGVFRDELGEDPPAEVELPGLGVVALLGIEGQGALPGQRLSHAPQSFAVLPCSRGRNGDDYATCGHGGGPPQHTGRRYLRARRR